MNFNNFTIKSQEAIQKAVEITKGSGNQAIEPVHLLKGVMSEGESLINFLFSKVGANIQGLTRQVDAQIASLPKVSGGEPYLSRTSNDVLQKALDISKSRATNTSPSKRCSWPYLKSARRPLRSSRTPD